MRGRQRWHTLSRHLGLPLFSKDVIKQAHTDVLGTDPARSCHHRLLRMDIDDTS